MARAFIAVDLPEKAVGEIKRIQELIKKKDFMAGKFTEPGNLHLTLKFLGEISEEQIEEVKKRLNEIKLSIFECRLSELGVFSPDFIKIIWIKLNGEEIFELQKEIDEKLKDLFEPEKRFMSHVTIARVKNVNDKNSFLNYLSSIKIGDIGFQVKNFYLMKSELTSSGPVYSELAKYELR